MQPILMHTKVLYKVRGTHALYNYTLALVGESRGLAHLRAGKQRARRQHTDLCRRAARGLQH